MRNLIIPSNRREEKALKVDDPAIHINRSDQDSDQGNAQDHHLEHVLEHAQDNDLVPISHDVHLRELLRDLIPISKDPVHIVLDLVPGRIDQVNLSRGPEFAQVARRAHDLIHDLVLVSLVNKCLHCGHLQQQHDRTPTCMEVQTVRYPILNSKEDHQKLRYHRGTHQGEAEGEREDQHEEALCHQKVLVEEEGVELEGEVCGQPLKDNNHDIIRCHREEESLMGHGRDRLEELLEEHNHHQG